MTPTKEQDLLNPVALYAQRKGYMLQKFEMPFFSYRIDLYGYSRTTQSTIAVELKLRKWRRALEQARVYQLCSDFVFIALPTISVPLVNLELLTAEGIGLIEVGFNKCRLIVPATQSCEVRRHYREPFVDILEGDIRAGPISKDNSSTRNPCGKRVL